MIYLLKPLTYTLAEREEFKKSEGLAAVAYVQSGCNPPSDRDAYVQELMKYIKIDSYGNAYWCRSKGKNDKIYYTADIIRAVEFILENFFSL